MSGWFWGTKTQGEEEVPGGDRNPRRGASVRAVNPKLIATLFRVEQSLEVEAGDNGSCLLVSEL
jgi:hypothetical protein